MPSLTQLEYLLAVDKYRHFAKAAKACFVAQPSLSMQLQKMEEELDVILFDRSKRPILPTSTGEKIIQQAKIIIREHRKLLEIPTQGGIDLEGPFRLGVIPTLAPYLIPLFLEKFSMQYPKVELQIDEFKTGEILYLLEEDELDAGLLVTPLHNNKLVERTLFYEPFYGFIGQNHPLIKKSKLSESDLIQGQVWMLKDGHCMRHQMIELCQKRSKSTILPNVSFQGEDLETLKNLVKKDIGMTLLPYLATLNLSKKEVQTMLKPFTRPIPSREIGLVTSRVFLKEKIVEALEKSILETIPKELTSLKNKEIEVLDLPKQDPIEVELKNLRNK